MAHLKLSICGALLKMETPGGAPLKHNNKYTRKVKNVRTLIYLYLNSSHKVVKVKLLDSNTPGKTNRKTKINTDINK